MIKLKVSLTLIIERMNDDRFKDKLGISDEKFHVISKALL